MIQCCHDHTNSTLPGAAGRSDGSRRRPGRDAAPARGRAAIRPGAVGLRLAMLVAAVILFGAGPALAQYTVGLNLNRTSGLEGHSGVSSFVMRPQFVGSSPGFGFIEVDYALSGPTFGYDYRGPRTGTLSINCDRGYCGTSSRTVYINGDVEVEPDEVLTITLSNLRVRHITATLAQTTYAYTIVNDDETGNQRAILRIHNVPMREGEHEARIEAQIIGTKAFPTIFHLTATPDAGTDPSDYTLSSTTITVPKGIDPISSGWVTMTANQDDDLNDEYVTLGGRVSGAGSGRVPGRVIRSQRIRIIDDDRAPCPGPGDPAPTLHWEMRPTFIQEFPGPNAAEAHVWIEGKTCNRSKVEVRALPGSGSAEDGDWVQQPAHIVWLMEGIDPQGDWTPTIYSEADADLDHETFDVKLTVLEAGHESVVAPSNHTQTVTIHDDDNVTMTPSATTVQEGGSITIDVRVDSGQTHAPTTVTLEGNTRTPTEWTIDPTVFTFDSIFQGATKTVTFTAHEDVNTTSEPVTITATLSGALQGRGTPLTVTIQDSGANEGEDQGGGAQGGPPQNLQVQGGNEQATLDWDPPKGGNPTGYDYQQNPPGGGGGSALRGRTAGTGGRRSATGGWSGWVDTGGTDTSHVVTGLDNGTSYTFRVRARYGDQTSDTAVSNAATATPVPPGDANSGAPVLTGRPGDTQVELTWTAPSGLTATGWEVEQNGGAWLLVPGSGSDTRSHLVAGLTNGQHYTFRVRSVNQGAAGEPSNPLTMTPAQATPALPAAALGLLAATLLAAGRRRMRRRARRAE